MADRLKIDLHMHTTLSDGTDTPRELLEKVKVAGIGLFSITDHDSVASAALLQELLGPGDPAFVPGVEFSCRDEKGKYHILGYHYDVSHAALTELVARGHGYRVEKARLRLDFLKSEFGFVFSPEDESEIFSANNPGKPHLATVMIRRGYAKDIRDAMETYINLAPNVRVPYVRPEEAIDAIIKAGGIPVLAHPFYGSGSELILGEDMENRLLRLMEMGIAGVEAFYSGFSAKMRQDMITMAERHDLYVTAGSDYHGANKLVRLNDTGLEECEKYPEGLLRFVEAVG